MSAKGGSLRKLRALALYLTLMLTFLLVSACKTTTEAAAAAKQLNTVATNLAAYYTELATQVDDTVQLNQLQGVLYKIPFPDSDRALMIDVKSEMLKRAAMAHSLADLGAAYGNLAGSTATSDACTAASELADELATAKAIPQGSAIPAVAGEAAKLLVSLVQARDLKKGSVGVSKAVTAVSDIFDGEKKAYESIENQRLALARLLAGKLVDNHEIAISFSTLVAPATKPFALSPKEKDLSENTDYKQLVKSEMDYRVADQQRKYVDLTDSMAAALHSVNDAVSRIAGKK